MEIKIIVQYTKGELDERWLGDDNDEEMEIRDTATSFEDAKEKLTQLEHSVEVDRQKLGRVILEDNED